MKKKSRSISRWKLFGKICYGILIGVISLIALMVILTILPLPGDFNLYIVRSGSMAPRLETGDLILTRKTGDYQVNDIITFAPSEASSERELVTHRVLERGQNQRGDFYVTKGDANEGSDGNRVTNERIRGEYWLRIPLVGYLIGFAKTLPGLVILIIIPVVIIIYDEIHKLRREIAKKRSEKRKGKNEKRDRS